VTLYDGRPGAASACEVGDRGADRATTADHDAPARAHSATVSGWLFSSKAALIERRGWVIVGPAQHIGLLRAFQSGPSRTISRTDPAHEVGHGVANLVGAILLEEMAPFHRHFGLVQPGALQSS